MLLLHNNRSSKLIHLSYGLTELAVMQTLVHQNILNSLVETCWLLLFQEVVWGRLIDCVIQL